MSDRPTPQAPPHRTIRLPAVDAVLLRRFGLVRAVGGAAYLLAVAVLVASFGLRAWPLALGVPVLAVVTTGYFRRFVRYPRSAVVLSLVADAVVLAGVVAFVGGTGSGLVLLYAIVVVSAGILLGAAAATTFTVVTVALALLQLLAEQLGYGPALLPRPDLSDRLTVLGASLAGLISVGYLTATYAGRLHELIAEAGERFEVARLRGRRRWLFVSRASVEVRQPLGRLEEVADELDERWAALTDGERSSLAGRLRVTVALLEAEVAQLADLGLLDSDAQRRPEPVLLSRVVEDCVVALGSRLAPYDVEVDVPPLKVLGDRRGIRRMVFNLLDNVVEHTPPGTSVHVAGRQIAGAGALIVTDNGPGVPPDETASLFEVPDEAAERGPNVGLPLVAELAESMGARVRYEPAPGGGSRFLVRLRLAPASAPSRDDEPGVGPEVAPDVDPRLDPSVDPGDDLGGEPAAADAATGR